MDDYMGLTLGLYVYHCFSQTAVKEWGKNLNSFLSRDFISDTPNHYNPNVVDLNGDKPMAPRLRNVYIGGCINGILLTNARVIQLITALGKKVCKRSI